MSNFIQSVVKAAADAGVQCVIVGPSGGAGEAPNDYSGIPPWQEQADAQRLQQAADSSHVDHQLQQQVQGLTAQINELQQEKIDLQQALASASTGEAAPAGAQAPAAPINAEWRERGVDTLGLEEKLTRKLTRIGHTTVGAVWDQFSGGFYADKDNKIKQAWQIQIGMKLTGASPGQIVAALGATTASGDVPDGHADRPWLERLGIMRAKQASLVELTEALAPLQEQARAYDDPDEIPAELDDQLIELESKVEVVQAQLVCGRYFMGLDGDKELTLDESLAQVGLTNYMEEPQPRLLPTG